MLSVLRRAAKGPFLTFTRRTTMAATKRKRPSIDTSKAINANEPPLKRRSSARDTIATAAAASFNPDINNAILDAPNATRASPDSDVNEEIVPGPIKQETLGESPLSDPPTSIEQPNKSKRGRGKKVTKAGNETIESGPKAKAIIKEEPDSQKKPSGSLEVGDPEAEDLEEADEEEIKEALSRAPPVNSDYLPLPWKGRLGYACLNTYLRQSNPPVFSSRTCRIQSILEHRHPLAHPDQPEHATKNRPDRNKPADVELGKRYLESICLANVRDIAKMIRWNDRYNIKFMRLSSEMFPFASHPEYGYELAPFAAKALAEAGQVIAQYGHRVTTHPGQFTQLGSPRKQVIDNAIRDLNYHDEMLTLLRLPPQSNRDAVMILHLGGMFEGKKETLDRFRENYARLSDSVKKRLVLENDDVIWSVHDLIPICEELNIPLVLDYHHHNIVFDAEQIREGTRDIMDLYPRIKAMWVKKGITQKMHYSEPTPAAITPRQRRKHNPRVATLPPCAPDMDLMIEAKDKEQAVFELMRTFKLPGHDTFNDIIPYVRNDDNKLALAAQNKKKKRADEPEPDLIPDGSVGMGGPEGRVYWPPSMEEWLRPKKREVKKKVSDPSSTGPSKSPVKKEPVADVEEHADSDVDATPATKKAKAAMRKKDASKAVALLDKEDSESAVQKGGKQSRTKKQTKRVISTPSVSDKEEEDEGEPFLDDQDDRFQVPPQTTKRSAPRKGNGRKAKSKSVNYAEEDGEEHE